MAYALHNAEALETLPVSIERPTEILQVALALDVSNGTQHRRRAPAQTRRKPLSWCACWWNVTSIVHSVSCFGFGSRADAEHVVQDTMLKLDASRTMGAWLSEIRPGCIALSPIAASICGAGLDDNVDAVPEPMDGTPDAFNTMQRGRAHELLETAMQRSTEQQRVAVILVVSWRHEEQ